MASEIGKGCSFPLPNTHSFGFVASVDLQSLPNLWVCFYPYPKFLKREMVLFMEFFPTFRKVGEIKLDVDPHRMDDECS